MKSKIAKITAEAVTLLSQCPNAEKDRASGLAERGLVFAEPFLRGVKRTGILLSVSYISRTLTSQFLTLAGLALGIKVI